MIGKPDPTTKIAIIIGQLAQGGSERQLYMFLERCDRKRWTPVVYVSGGPMGFWDDPIRELGISVTLLQGGHLAKMWRFRQSCRCSNARRFFSWSAHTNRFGLALWGLGVNCIGSYRNVYPAESPEHYGRLRSWLGFIAVSTVVCNSQEAAAAVRSRMGRRKRVVYIPNGVLTVENAERCRREWRQYLKIADGEVMILGVGRLTPQKNFARWIETVARVHQTTPIRAVIAGRDDGCGESLQRQIDHLGLGADVIRMIGAVPDARELLCAADICLLSSDYEGMPNVVLEAMAAGVPCVCTKVNGVSVLIEEGVDGFVTDRRADALAEKVLNLARDKTLRREMGVRAAQRMKTAFDPGVIAARLWQLCE